MTYGRELLQTAPNDHHNDNNENEDDNINNNDHNGNDNDNEYIDITSMIQQYSNEILNEQNPFLCHDNTFSLQDAMGATQLMDPKMDCCQIPISAYQIQNDEKHDTTTIKSVQSPSSNPSHNDSNNEQKQLQQQQNNNNNNRMIYPRPMICGLYDPMSSHLPWKHLQFYDTTIIVIQLLVRYQSFLSGASIGESTFTCLYTHQSVLSDMYEELTPFLVGEGGLSLEEEEENTTIPPSRSTTITTQISDDDIIDPDDGNDRNGEQQEQNLVSSFRTQIQISDHNNNHHSQYHQDEIQQQQQRKEGKEKEEINKMFVAKLALFASAVAIVDTSEVIRGVILNADIYEEEDFTSNNYNIPFFTDQVEINTNQLLQQAIEKIDALIIQQHHEQQQQLDKNNASNGLLDKEMMSLRMTRIILDYQLDFYIICTTFAKLSQTNLKQTVLNVQSTIQNSLEKITTLLTLLQNESCYEMFVSDIYCQKIILHSFDSYMSRPCVGNIPVRKIVFETPVTALLMLQTITNELDTILCNILLNGTSLRRIYRIMDRNINYSTTQGNKIPKINILTRSLLLLNMYFDEKLLGQYSLKQLIIDDITRSQSDDDSNYYHLVREFLLSTEITSALVNRLAKPIYDTLKLRLLNSNRHRSYIEAVSLPDWIIVQSEASMVDMHCRRILVQQQQQQNHQKSSPPNLSNNLNPESFCFFSQYAMNVLIRLMDRYIESGFEAGLFQSVNNQNHYDVSFALWYRAFLLSALTLEYTNRKNNTNNNNDTGVMDETGISTTNDTTIQTNQPKIQQSKSHSNKKYLKHGKKKLTHPKNKLSPSNNTVVSNDELGNQSTQPNMNSEQLEDLFEYKLLLSKQQLCRKTVEFIAALVQAKLLPNMVQQKQMNVYKFTSLSCIFQKRFEVFQCIRQPPPLSYENYLEGIDFSTVTQKELLQSASVGFQSIKSKLEELSKALVLQSSTVTNDDLAPTKASIQSNYAAASQDEIMALIKICLGNIVYIEKLKQIVEDEDSIIHTSIESTLTTTSKERPSNRKNKIQVVFDFETHQQFCTIKLISK